MKIVSKSFSELSLEELYNIFKLRAAVFVVEQNCVYQDVDDLDQEAIHVLGVEGRVLVAYSRILRPGAYYKEPAIGRVVTSKEVRGKSNGKDVFKASILETRRMFPKEPIRIMAQSYLIKFYQEFGFEVCSQEFLEDDIPHVEMLLE